jgi:hypothetical protein
LRNNYVNVHPFFVVFQLVLAVLACAASAGRLDNNYVQPQGQNVRTGPTPPPPAIVRLTNDNRGDGSYKFE